MTSSPLHRVPRRGLSAAKPRILLAPLLLALSACHTNDRAAVDLPPVHPRPLPHLEPPTNPQLPAAQARIFIQQFVLPLDVPTDPAWEKIDELAFPPVTRSAWQANGLRVGLVARKDLADVLKLLPPAYANQSRKLIASAHPTAIRRSPPLRAPFIVDLTLPPLAVREERIVAGRAQLLLSVDPNHVLYLTPHHHKLQPRLVPASILEKELDGRIFQELALAVAPGRDKVLAVGLHRPWPITPLTSGSSATGGLDVDAIVERARQQSENEGAASAAAPPGPFDRYDLDHPPPLDDDTLGRALFTGISAGKPAQLLLLITVDPLDAAPLLQ